MEFIGAGPRRSEWTSSKGVNAVNWDLGKGKLCIFPYKQCVQELSTKVHLLKSTLTLGNNCLRTWSKECPSLKCQRVLLKPELLVTLLHDLEDKESWEAF